MSRSENDLTDLVKGVLSDLPPYLSCYLRLDGVLSYFFEKHPSLFGINYRDISFFKLLEEYERKINLFLYIYLSNKPIVTMATLEKDLINHLKMFQLPSLYSTLESMNKSELDPYEIDLDEGEKDKKVSLFIPLRFSHFGLGSLHCHPQLVSHLQMPLTPPIPPPESLSLDYFYFPDTSLVFQNILKIVTHNFKDDEENFESQRDNFISCFVSSLSSSLSTHSLASIGVILLMNPFELLDYFLYNENFSINMNQVRQPSIEMRREEVKIIQRFSSPILRKPIQPTLVAFLSQISDALDLQPESFSPSLSKIKSVIEDRTQAIFSESNVLLTKKRKLSGGIPLDMLIEVASEYAFLHYGNKKQVTKRYEEEEEQNEIKVNLEIKDKDEDQKEEKDINKAKLELKIQDNLELHKEVEIHEASGQKLDYRKDILINRFIQLEDEKVKGLTKTIKQPIFHPSDEYNSITAKLIIKKSLLSVDSSAFFNYSPALYSTHSDLIEIISNSRIREIVTQFPLLEETDSFSIGKWGEALVYQYLLLEKKHDKLISNVEWVNESNETKSSYDIKLLKKNSQSMKDETFFIEVKSTRFDNKNSFNISLWEWKFATELPKVNYHIYRVRSAGDPLKVSIVVLKDVNELIERGGLKMSLSHPLNL